MNNNIDSIVDKALDKPRKILEEPKHVLIHRMFKSWKLFKYETPFKDEAFNKFNAVMEKLSLCSNVVVDVKRSRVMQKDISPSCVMHADLKYVVEVYWRDAY